MDILAEGKRRFEVLGLNQERSFLQADVIYLDDENEPQPDLLLRLPERAGGRSRVSVDDFLEGPVEFVAEVAASSVSVWAESVIRIGLRMLSTGRNRTSEAVS